MTAKKELPYRKIVDFSVDAIVVVDDRFNIVLWNSAAESMFGYSTAEVIDKPLMDIVVPDRYKKAKKEGIALFKKTGIGPVIGKTVQLEARKKDGSEFDIELSVSTVQRDTSLYAVGVCRDISEKRKVEKDIRESEERLRILFDYAPDAYYLNDLSGRLIDVNKAAEAMIGDEKANLVGKTLLQIGIVPKDQIQQAVEILRKNKEGSPTGPDELRLRRRTGSELCVEIRTYPMEVGNENLVLGIARDISRRKNAEIELRKERDFFESIVNSLPGIFYIVDDKLDFLRWNRNLENITGYSHTEIPKMSLLDFFDTENHGEIAKRIEEVLAKGQSTVETNLVSRDGTKIPFFLSATDVPVGEGHFLAGVGIDVSERKEAETKLADINELLINRTIELRKSEIKWLSLFMTSKDTIYMSTADGRITDINPAGIALFGYTEDEIASLDAAHLYVDVNDRARFEREIKDNEYVRDFEVVYKRKDGSRIECLETAVVRKDESGNVAGYQGIIRDVSERKRLLCELNEAKVNAEQANTVKSQFLANMSHEIRTPMNAILGFSELLMEEDLSEDQRESVKAISESGQTLLNLINDILDLSKIESGAATINNEEFFLFELLNGIATITRLKAREKGITLDLMIDSDTAPKIITDSDKLRQIILNLIANAVKFTDQGGVSITVHTDMVDAESVRLSISVSDTGCGIPGEKLQLIFDPFTQADALTTRKYGGTGLGLSITRKLIDLLGGKIGVSSEVGKGSVFDFWVPVGIPKAKALEIDREQTNVIVVIEDDPLTLKLYRHLFERNGFTVFTATEGKRALPLVIQHKPVLIILDVLLPDISGWDVLRQLKKNEKTADIPVIVISVLSEKEKAISLGAIDYLEKPIMGEALINKIEMLKRISGAEKRLTVLIVDDDKPILDFLTEMLREEGFSPVSFSDPTDAFAYLKEGNKVDLILLDVFLEKMTGFDFLLSLKHNQVVDNVPVIFITGKAITEQDTAKLEGITHSLLDESQLSSRTVLTQIEQIIQKFRPSAAKGGEPFYAGLGRKGTVLLVEDNELNRKLISKILDREQYTVATATNGREAVEMVQTESFDLILMDIQMPVMDGYEATRLIKSDARAGNVPIVALTAHAMKGEREKILDAGFDGYLTKPVKKEELIREIAAHLLRKTPTPVSPEGSKDEPMVSEELMEIFREFDESLPGRYRELTQAAESRDYETLSRIGHDLKGTGGAFRREKVSILGRQIEVAAKERNDAVITFVLSSFLEEVDRIGRDRHSAPESTGEPNVTGENTAPED
jgi:PAS domain S-box-containing protein